VAITIFAKLEAFLLSSKSNRAVVPSIFGFPRDLLGHSRALLAKAAPRLLDRCAAKVLNLVAEGIGRNKHGSNRPDVINVIF